MTALNPYEPPSWEAMEQKEAAKASSADAWQLRLVYVSLTLLVLPITLALLMSSILLVQWLLPRDQFIYSVQISVFCAILVATATLWSFAWVMSYYVKVDERKFPME
jgi:hypothetical protein